MNTAANAGLTVEARAVAAMDGDYNHLLQVIVAHTKW